MKCPKCGSEIQQQHAQVLYGLKDNQVEVLAEGEFIIAICCGVAILTEKSKEQSAIETQPQSIILPV